MTFTDPLTVKIADFLNGIGIEVLSASFAEETFLPGIMVENGRLLVDESKLKFPGDMLHEAGHLAVAPRELRSSLSGEVNLKGEIMNAIESQAMAWSYAALLHLELKPKIVFHEGGYRGLSKRLLINFELGVYLGANGLEKAGMTATGEAAAALGMAPYRHMLKWVRD
ncbi:MAG: hypothetical protein QOD75_1273 [Blastocatellia bacterium]|jgi:hypothetical protein|nr:hypothetical protein [Blastocatellia bacterium]